MYASWNGTFMLVLFHRQCGLYLSSTVVPIIGIDQVKTTPPSCKRMIRIFVNEAAIQFIGRKQITANEVLDSIYKDTKAEMVSPKRIASTQPEDHQSVVVSPIFWLLEPDAFWFLEADSQEVIKGGQ